MNAFIFQSLVIGIAGTAAMDLWALLLNRQAGVASPNWAYVGRWFLHLPRGKIFHADIAASKSFPFESEAGWIAHYVTGIVYGGALLKIMGESYAHAPTLFPALILAYRYSGVVYSSAWNGRRMGCIKTRQPMDHSFFKSRFT